MRKIFGTGTLHWLSKKSRDKIIDTALNNGFSQFDTSGVYGLGATNKYLGSLGLSKDIKFSAKMGLTSTKALSSSRLEVLIRKIFFYRASKIEEDNCYSSWQRQFEIQMTDLGVTKFQRLLLQERYITPDLWKLFNKFINQYKDHFDEYGVSANWLTLRPTISHIYDKKLVIQTTPDILTDSKLNDLMKITLYGISKIYNKTNYINYGIKLDGIIYFSSNISRIQNVFTDRY